MKCSHCLMIDFDTRLRRAALISKERESKTNHNKYKLAFSLALRGMFVSVPLSTMLIRNCPSTNFSYC
jgi:hypothetical protein